MLKKHFSIKFSLFFFSFLITTHSFAAKEVHLTCEQMQNLHDNNIKNCFIGTWKVVANLKKEGNIITYPFGKDEVGYITYDDNGYMSVQMMQQNRKTILPGYFAYFGKYEIDPVNNVVHHFLDGSLNPIDVGKDRIRHYRFTANQLHLIPVEETNREIIWEKMPPSK